MSLAVSAHIGPSGRFSACVGAMAAVTFITGILALSERIGAFSMAGRIIVGGTSFAAAAAFVCLYRCFRKSFLIDISGSGQIRISEAKSSSSIPDSETFSLAEGSTLWPMLLLLQLVSDSGRKKRVMIFPDAVKEEDFKALYITCRWLAVHGKEKR
jgi:hypothetical protein